METFQVETSSRRVLKELSNTFFETQSEISDKIKEQKDEARQFKQKLETIETVVRNL
jgi:hypothetical protein